MTNQAHIGFILALLALVGCDEIATVDREFDRGYVAGLDGIRTWESADAPQPPAPAPKPGVCPSCDGTGKQTTDGRVAPGPCPDCGGTGRIGDEPRRQPAPPAAPAPPSILGTTKRAPDPKTGRQWEWKAERETTLPDGRPGILWVPVRPLSWVRDRGAPFVDVAPHTLDAWRRHVAWHGVPWTIVHQMDMRELQLAHANCHAGYSWHGG